MTWAATPPSPQPPKTPSRSAAIWAGYGLTLSVDYDTRPEVDAALPAMTEGSEHINEISATGTDADITVLIGDTVGGTTQIYGESGGIPGTLVEGNQSVVALSWITNAGGDGTFSSDDIRIYGETLAHEVGHYMGLFHPVDFDRNRPLYWDALSDTDECQSSSDCDESLGENNMYPYPVCTGFNNCLDQQTSPTARRACCTATRAPCSPATHAPTPTSHTPEPPCSPFSPSPPAPAPPPRPTARTPSTKPSCPGTSSSPAPSSPPCRPPPRAT